MRRPKLPFPEFSEEAYLAASNYAEYILDGIRSKERSRKRRKIEIITWDDFIKSMDDISMFDTCSSDEEYSVYPTQRTSGTSLLRPMGFEFTLEKKNRPNNFKYKAILAKLKKLGYRGYVDNGCLEINSPIFKYMEDVIDFWKKLRKDCGKEYIPRNKTSTGGGTHIHIGLIKQPPDIVDGKLIDRKKILPSEMEFRERLVALIWNRPWLTWLFQDPSDDSTSEPICNDSSNKEYIEEFGCLGDKQCSVRDESAFCTFEFRFFDTATSAKDLKAFVMAANYLLKMASEKPLEKFSSKSKFELQLMLLSEKTLQSARQFLLESGVEYSLKKLQYRAKFLRQSVHDDYQDVLSKKGIGF